MTQEMTYEEAKEIIEDMCTTWSEDGDEALNVAIEALEKQIEAKMTNMIEMPEPIKYIPLEDTTEDGLNAFVDKHDSSIGFIVYLRCRYDYEEDWTYLKEILEWDSWGTIWQSDWWEGQQHVEYLGVAVIEY